MLKLKKRVLATACSNERPTTMASRQSDGPDRLRRINSERIDAVSASIEQTPAVPATIAPIVVVAAVTAEPATNDHGVSIFKVLGLPCRSFEIQIAPLKLQSFLLKAGLTELFRELDPGLQIGLALPDGRSRYFERRFLLLDLFLELEVFDGRDTLTAVHAIAELDALRNSS